MEQGDARNIGPKDEVNGVVQYKNGSKIKNKDSRLRQLAILFCGFYCQFSVGASFGTGDIYAELVSRYPKASRELLAFVFTLSMGLSSIGGSLSSILISKVGSRWTLVIATLLATFGLSISFLATGVEFLLISFGLILGMGCGLINVTSMVAVKDYFGDNAKLAMSIVSIGSGIGGVSFQQASAFGIQTFGWRGAMFMLAGMMLNVMIPAFAMPPVPKDQKVPTHDTRNTWKIPPILTSVAFDLWLLFVFTISMCVSMMLIIFPHYLTIKGFSSYDATTFLSLSIIMGFPGRVILIFLMKFCRIPTSVYIFLTGLSISVSILILVYMNTTATVLLSTLVSGTGFGFWIILLWAGTLDISGSELYASAQSLVIFTFGVATFLSGPFAGFILEQTETYDIAYLASAGGLLGASVLYLLVPATNYCKQRGSRYERL